MDGQVSRNSVLSRLHDAANAAVDARNQLAQWLSDTLDEYGATGHAVKGVYSTGRELVLDIIGARFGRGAKAAAAFALPGIDDMEELTLESLAERISFLEVEIAHLRAGVEPPDRPVKQSSELKAALAAAAEGFLGELIARLNTELREGIGWT